MEKEHLILVVKFPDNYFWATFAHIFAAIDYASDMIGGFDNLEPDTISDMILSLSDPMYFMAHGYKYEHGSLRDYFASKMEVYLGKYANDILMLRNRPFQYYALDTRLEKDNRFIICDS